MKDPRSIACPKCGAEKGSPCLGPEILNFYGKPYKPRVRRRLTRVHTERRRDAERRPGQAHNIPRENRPVVPRQRAYEVVCPMCKAAIGELCHRTTKTLEDGTFEHLPDGECGTLMRAPHWPRWHVVKAKVQEEANVRQ